MSSNQNKELFETMKVSKAVRIMAVPTIIGNSQKVQRKAS